ncbi:MAG: NosD domain-containing protein [Promethearchaeota archaeon]
MKMEKYRKKSVKTVLLVVLFLIFNFTPILPYIIPKGVIKNKIHDNFIPNLSDINKIFIHIDNNWTETAANYDWCSGSGSWNDPFIIEDVDIFTNATIAAIFINNSQSVHFIIRDCILSNNSTDSFSAGIRLENSENGRIMDISCYHNSVGIMLIDSHNSSIEGNDIFSNNYGIYLNQSSSENIIYENNIFDNLLQGVNVANSNNNNIYSNTFINNTIHANDSGMNNAWNIGDQGNSWDDYVGKDTDDNGIGDTPYIISGLAGSQDYSPVWWDAPLITIISPIPYSLYGSSSLNFSVSLEEGVSHSWWYMIDSDPTKNHFNTNGSINALVWSLLVNGSHTIFFYVNDSRGYEDSRAIIVYKDIETPSIDIIFPGLLSIFGNDTCNFTIIILESNLNSTWYTVNNGTPIYFNGISGQNDGIISESEWELQSNGTIIINFFANDTMGNLGKNNVTIYKDIIPPTIQINRPAEYEIFGISPPECNVSFYDINGVNTTWYYLTDGITITPKREWTGTIHSDDWDTMSNGTVTIFFYANDTISNIGMINISIYKDIIAPNILINEPKPYNLFSVTPPICDVSFYDINGVNETWYQLTNGTFTTNSRIWTGSIDISDWNIMGNGTVTIMFFANDSIGNINSENVIIYKDIISPYITINEPKLHDLFGQNPPDCNITLYDINSIDTVWYKLTDGITTSSFREWSGTIDLNDWAAMSNGSVTIIFYANDTLGNIATTNVSVYKDVIAPIININEPNPYEVFGTLQPECNVSFYDINGVDTKWYQLTDGTVSTTLREWIGMIDFNDWTILGNGSVTIIFYANDTLGNIATADLSLYKDIIAPTIIINEPLAHDLYGQDPPNCNLTLYDINFIDYIWYELTDGTTTTNVRDWTGTIQIDDWINMANGTVFIIFYANDTLGNIATTNVSVYKDIISPSITINEPNFQEIFGHIAPNCDLTLYDRNSIDYVWYKLTNGTFTTTIREWTGFLHADDWNAMSNGTLTLIFYANDTLGNIGTSNVSIYKDIIAPSININEPHPYDLAGTIPPMCDVTFYDTNGVNTTWYQLTNGTITTNSQVWTGSIDINDWSMIGNGSLIIILYANDSVGNLNFDTINLYKDIRSPVIVINNPQAYEIFGQIPPMCNLTLYDRNSIDYVWYELTDGIISTPIREWTGFIHIDDWKAMSNGTVTIFFYANDTLGNKEALSISIYKDIYGPEINIAEPLPHSVFGINPPPCTVIFTDINGVNETWYQLTDGITTTNGRIWAGSIQLDDWNMMSNGSVTIVFYANDTVSNIGMSNVSIYKDVIGPDINIISPTPHRVLGKPVPSCIVTFYDINGVDSKWSQLTNGIITTPLREWSGFIYTSDWNTMPNGTVFIVFFANDTLDNMISVNISIYKDSISPIIIIHDPQDGQLYGITAPIINVTVSDAHLESVWYQLDNGSVITPYQEWLGFIYQEDWDQIGNGSVIIRFIAYDSVNNLASATLNLRKNLFDPIIIILDPSDNDLFGLNRPNITLYISSASIDTIWYQLYNTTFSTSNIIWDGSVDPIAWEAFRNGTLSIVFYINDTLGNVGFNTISLRKDTISPTLLINSPIPFTLFGTTPPGVSITCYDENSIFSISYQLFNVLITPSRIWTGSILSTDWNTIGNGTVIIMFCAEDIVGNLAYANLSVRKDIIAPEVLIYYPDTNELYGHERPILYVYIDDGSGVSEISYRLTSESNTSSIIDWNDIDNHVIEIDQSLWNQFSNGSITIYLYVFDIIGNQRTTPVTVRKDIIAPSISILSPAQNQNVERDPPFFEVDITDGNLFYSWYNIIGINVNVSFVGRYGRIDQTLWESIWDNTTINGNITIRFYAEDRMNNRNFSELVVIKYVPTLPFTPIPLPFEITDLIFLGCLGGVAITFPLIMKKSRYYSSGDKKQKNIIKRVMLLIIVLLTLITVAMFIT